MRVATYHPHPQIAHELLAEVLRRVLYIFTLLLMVVVLWVATWSSQLQGQARVGWMSAPPHADLTSSR